MAQVYVLDRIGGLDTPKKIMRQLLQWFMSSEKNRSIYFREYTYSLKEILTKYNNTGDADTAIDEIIYALKRMYGAYFSAVDVDCEFITNKDNKTLVSIKISVETKDNDIVTLEDAVEYNKKYIIDKNIYLNTYNKYSKIKGSN